VVSGFGFRIANDRRGVSIWGTRGYCELGSCKGCKGSGFRVDLGFGWCQDCKFYMVGIPGH
jgi:hypothetical protein